MSTLRRAALAAILASVSFAQTIVLPGQSTPVSLSWLYYNKMRWAGAWSSTATYNPQDVVSYNLSVWVSLAAGNLNNTPVASAWWAQIFNGSLPSGSPLQYLRLQPNSGNGATLQFANLPVVSVSDYSFPAQTPGGSLLALGVGQTIAMAPCPLGMNGTDSAHFVYLSGGTGAAEDTVITGGTCVSGAASGSITVTPTNAHSGAWTVQSDAIGIPEAIQAVCASGGGRLIIPVSGTVTLYGGFTVPAACNISLRGLGMDSTYLQMSSSTVGGPGLTGGWFTWATGAGGTGSSIDLGDLSINDLAGTNHTAGSVVSLQTRQQGSVSNLELHNGYDVLTCSNCAANMNFHNVHLFGAHFGLSFIGTQTQANISDSTISAGSAAINLSNTQTTGFYVANTLLDNTASGGTSGSSCIRFTQVGTNVVNEVVLTGNDCESVGDGFEFNGAAGAGYPNSSAHITGSRINTGTYAVYASGKWSGIHVTGNYLIAAGVGTAAAAIYASDVQDLAVIGNRYYLQSTGLYFVQGGGTTSKNWLIANNAMDVNNTATLTYAVELINGMDKVIITNNDFSGIAWHVNAVTGLTNSRISGNNGLQVFANLPACASGLEASDAAVSDSSTSVWGATVTGSSSSHVLARCNGTNWTVVAK